MRLTSQKGFSGIDERIEIQGAPNVANEMMNFRITDAGSLIKRAGTKYLCSFEESEITGIWCGNLNGVDSVYVIANSALYRLDPNAEECLPEHIADLPFNEEHQMFEFNGKLYFKSQNHYGKYDGESYSEVEGYIPCVATNCAYSGEGQVLEQINLLNDKRRQLFSADGNHFHFRLAENDIDSIVSVKIDGVEYDGRYSLSSRRDIVFEHTPPEGINNIEVIYSKAMPESDKRRIMGCTHIMMFGGNSDGRAFLWGNPDLPNYRFHSELADGIPSVEYFPVNAFTVIGNSKINCIVQQYDKQLIFTKNEAYYSYCELRDDGLGNVISSFPVYSLNGSKGCLIETDGCIIDNRPITLCEDGLNMWEATNVENEKNAVCFSKPIQKTVMRLLSEKKPVSLFDFQANRELYIITEELVYIYNYGNGSWYVYDYLQGKYHSSIGGTLYYASGMKLFSYSNSFDADEYNTCIWKSAFIDVSQKSGLCDVVGFEADVHVRGDVKLEFSLERGNGNALASRVFEFVGHDDEFLRLSFRPALKRAMPFRVKITATGEGMFSIHGLSIKTREKERSKRNGLC